MKQEFEKYTSEDLLVWRILFERQASNLLSKAGKDYLFALDEMKEVLNKEALPSFKKIDHWFSTRTGWQIECVPGLIDMEDFFMLLAQKKFPSSTWLRSMDKLDYLEEPDMFHDIFGHVPLLSNPIYSDFIQKFGELGMRHIEDKEVLIMLQRLYWFTIEFGLVVEARENKIYGAGIISSFGESNTSLKSPEMERLNFDLETVLKTEFCTSEIQSKYFIINDLNQLILSIELLSTHWKIGRYRLPSFEV